VIQWTDERITMSRKTIVILVAVIIFLVLIYSMRGTIAERRFKGKADRLAEKIPEQHREHYGSEFRYAMDKFWDSYEEGIVSENDLMDVTDYMDDLNSREKVSRKEIFDFLDYVTGIYTSEIKKKQEEEYGHGAG